MRNRFKFSSTRKKNNGYQELILDGKKSDVINIYDSNLNRVGFIHKEFGKDFEVVFEKDLFLRIG